MVLFCACAIVAVVVGFPSSIHAAPPPTAVVLDGTSFAIRTRPLAGTPDTAKPAAGPTDNPAPRVIAGHTHFRWGVGTKTRALPFRTRDWTVVAEASLTVLQRYRPGRDHSTHAVVDATGKHVLFKLPSTSAPNAHALCANRYLVAVGRIGPTLIFDLERMTLLQRDAEAGVHDRADRYRGPTCSPDGRFAAVPDTHAGAVFVYRLVDGARIAHIDFRPHDPGSSGDVPAHVIWHIAPEPMLVVEMIPDPIAVNPPK